MVKNNILLLMALFLTACATTPPGVKVETQRVEVPVEKPCSVAEPEQPKDNFDSLTTEEDVRTKVQALLADRLNHLGYEEKLRSALNTCTK
jgi:hypothetical protein